MTGPISVTERIAASDRNGVVVDGRPYTMITGEDYENIRAEAGINGRDMITRPTTPTSRSIIVEYNGSEYYYSEEAQRQDLVEQRVVMQDRLDTERLRMQSLMQQPVTPEEAHPVGQGILAQIENTNTVPYNEELTYERLSEVIDEISSPILEPEPRRVSSVLWRTVNSVEEMEQLIATEGDTCAIPELGQIYVYNGTEWVLHQGAGDDRIEREAHLETQHGQPVVVELGTLPEGYKIGDLVKLYNTTGIIIAGNEGRPCIVPYRPEIDGHNEMLPKPTPKIKEPTVPKDFLANVI